MLRGVIICPDQELNKNLEASLLHMKSLGISRSIKRYPDAVDLGRTIRAHGPDVVFLSVESMPQAIEIVHSVDVNFPGLQIVAVHSACDEKALLEIMQIGVREFIYLPFAQPSLTETLNRVEAQAQKRSTSIASTDQVFSFLPSKPGVGTSTIALHVGVELAKLPKASVLLSDFDLSSGILKFMLKLDNGYSVIDAVEHAEEMDENLWPPLVTSLNKLDVLHAGKLDPGLRIEADQIRHLLEFMRRNYKTLCFDLSGNLEKYSIEIMQECKRIFVVCTPELPSLHLAREKYLLLKRLELDDRVSILLNRCPKHPLIGPAHVEQLLGVPVQTIFVNDYHGLHKALTLGRTVEPATELGQQFAAFAKSIVKKETPPAKTEPKRRFMEFFSIIPKGVPVEGK